MRSLILHRVSLIIVFIIVHILLFIVFGVRMLFDSKRYLEQADFLLAQGAFEESSQWFYAIPIGLIAVCRWVFPDTVIPFLILQIGISALAMVSLYKATEVIFRSKLSAWFAVVIFLIWCDNVQWNTAVMTESVFCSLICFLLYAVVRFQGKLVDWLAVALVVLCLMLTRPTGIILVVGVCAYLLRYYWNVLAARSTLKFMVLTFLAMTALAGAYMMFSQWDFMEQLEKGNIVTYADVIESGRELRTDTTGVSFASSNEHPAAKIAFFIVKNPWYVFKTGTIKVWYLMSATRPYYSWKHNVYSFIWVAFVYALCGVGFRECKKTEMKYTLVSVVMANCLLVCIGTVDWDNRFYIPMAPCIVLFAGGGAAFVLRKWFPTKIESIETRLQCKR